LLLHKYASQLTPPHCTPPHFWLPQSKASPFSFVIYSKIFIISHLPSIWVGSFSALSILEACHYLALALHRGSGHLPARRVDPLDLISYHLSAQNISISSCELQLIYLSFGTSSIGLTRIEKVSSLTTLDSDLQDCFPWVNDQNSQFFSYASMNSS
jgi:hypothetical protein